MELNLKENILNVSIGDIIDSLSDQDLSKQVSYVMKDLNEGIKDIAIEYQALLSSNKFEDANEYRMKHPELETRIFDAYKANVLAEKIFYLYLYAKAQLNQITISDEQPQALVLSDDESNFIGQEQGDIWLKPNEGSHQMCIKMNDDVYMQKSLSPITATNSDISQINFDSDSSITNPHRPIDLTGLGEFDKDVLASRIDDRKNNEFVDLYTSYKQYLANAYLETHQGMEMPVAFNNFINSGLLPAEDNYKIMIPTFIRNNFSHINNREPNVVETTSQIGATKNGNLSFIIDDKKYYSYENISKEYNKCYTTKYAPLLSYFTVSVIKATRTYTTTNKNLVDFKVTYEAPSSDPYEFVVYVYVNSFQDFKNCNRLVFNAESERMEDFLHFEYRDDLPSSKFLFEIQKNAYTSPVQHIESKGKNYWQYQVSEFYFTPDITICTFY